AVRHVLAPWINSRGLSGISTVQRRVKVTIAAELAARIRRSTDLDELVSWCHDEDLAVADEAVLRLVELGELGVTRLANSLLQSIPARAASSIAATISLWPTGGAVESLRTIASASAQGISPEIQFEVALGFCERGEREYATHAIEAACRECRHSWFR